MNDKEGLIKPGDIKAFRVNEMINQPAVNKNKCQPSMVRHEVAKKILGTVPVYADGSSVGNLTEAYVQNTESLIIVNGRLRTLCEANEIEECGPQ